MDIEMMEIKDIKVSGIDSFLWSSIQPFPFDIEHAVVKKNIVKAIRQGLTSENHQSKVLGFFHQKKLVALVHLKTGQELEIVEILVDRQTYSKRIILTKIFLSIRSFGYEIGAKTLSLDLVQLDLNVNDWLLRQGFIKQKTNDSTSESHHFQLVLPYRSALVLGGGGARGSYQIGVWKAFKELGISFDLIVGTSVGSLNGALMLQDDLRIAQKMWAEIETSKILAFETSYSDESQKVEDYLKNVQSFAANALRDKGVSTKPLQNMLDFYLESDKMFRPKMDFYAVTTAAPSLVEKVIDIRDQTPESLKKWLLASSSFFPLMEAAKIDGNYYVDGGYKNNVPVDVALDKWATKIVVVDVHGPGITKKIKIPDYVDYQLITSKWSLGTVLFFDKSHARWNMDLGYLETMKTYGYYEGSWYTLKKANIKRDLTTLIEKLYARREKIVELKQNDRLTNIISNDKVLTFQGQEIKHITDVIQILPVIEEIARLLEVDPTQAYTISQLRHSIDEKLKNLKEDSEFKLETQDTRMLDGKEWGRRLMNRFPMISEAHQLILAINFLKGKKTSADSLLKQPVVQHFSKVFKQAVFLMLWLEIALDVDEEE